MINGVFFQMFILCARFEVPSRSTGKDIISTVAN